MSKAWEGGSTSRWRAFRLAILTRDKWQCTIVDKGCTGKATHVDHIIMLHMGGQKYDPLNARASCESCNLKRKRTNVQPEPAPKRVSSW